ncbi:MAG: hypothetical protein H6873_10980 [Hyphomicrobiaceae bacterium]|nr:hypothetical protein [Hyphomicrobiaceae bacterium]
MKLRLLPVVLVAAIALLVLKTIGLVTEGHYALTGTEFARAQTAADPAVQLTPDEEATARRAADSLFATTAAAMDGNNGDVAEVTTKDRDGNVIPLDQTDQNAVTERAVLERLSQRRAELDAYSEQLDVRADLVAAAEARIEERMTALQALETRVQALVDQFDAKADEQFTALVSMYENMKPSDAATVFNQLDADVLLRLASNISPRKMSQILAAMDASRAQDLTIRLANLNEAAKMPTEPASMGSNELPQIIGQ